jgi:hypothetical protein
MAGTLTSIIRLNELSNANTYLKPLFPGDAYWEITFLQPDEK